jgi:hypothetical protein
MKPSAIRIERMLEKLEAALVPPLRPCLKAIVHEGDDQTEQMKKALAEHVALHPEDAGCTVKDFRWIVHDFRPPSAAEILEAGLCLRDEIEDERIPRTDGPSEPIDERIPLNGTDGPSETLEPINLPPLAPPPIVRSKPWRPVHQRPARDQRRPTWKKWSGNGHGG